MKSLEKEMAEQQAKAKAVFDQFFKTNPESREKVSLDSYKKRQNENHQDRQNENHDKEVKS
jgi:hypothetical protein